MEIESVATPAPLPDRPADGNKGTFGRLLIVGGNDEMIGAPVLAGMAALRTGAGLVQVALPKSVLAPALSICPELIGLALAGPDDDKRLLDAAEKADAVVVGPGLGQSTDARERLMALVALDRPMVVDADGLNLLAAMGNWPSEKFRPRAVLTPHPGEMRRLANLLPKHEIGPWANAIPADDAARLNIAITAARAFGQTIVLKGARTVVTDGQRVYINRTGDSTLSKAGTGDVLSGMIGSLLGQKEDEGKLMDLFDAACAAVHLHGRCGELAGKRLGQRCALAREIIDAIPQAVAEYEREVGHP
jgi:NAD(P)H-hydrate epimerase